MIGVPVSKCLKELDDSGCHRFQDFLACQISQFRVLQRPYSFQFTAEDNFQMRRRFKSGNPEHVGDLLDGVRAVQGFEAGPGVAIFRVRLGRNRTLSDLGRCGCQRLPVNKFMKLKLLTSQCKFSFGQVSYAII